jgi:hypothetical protein
MIKLIVVLDEVAASAVNSNIEINFYSDNCGGQGENNFVISAYLHAVTNVQIHSVTHKYLAVCHIHNVGDSSCSLIENYYTRYLKSGPVLFRHSMLQLLELHGRTESHSKFTIGP